MPRIYSLNQESANAARTVGVSSRINERGAYKGKFIVAEAVTSRGGTEGIEFRFEADDGRTADYLTVWTHKNDGTELSGARLVSALMVCVQARSCTPQRASVRKWDSTARAEVSVNAEVYQELMNKPIGLLLAREEYQKQDGSTGWKMAIAAPFDYATERTAAEVLDKKPAGGALPKMIELLRDRPLANKRTTSGGSSASGGGKSPTSFDDMDDDISF